MEEPPESHKTEKDLVGVLFPGIVNNDEKAIQYLGGIRNISQVHSNPHKKRLGLTFQPDNPFMKKAYADSHRNAGVLIKVKVKKTKVGDEVRREVISTSVIGRVKRMHHFNSMCDFQYLPVHKESGSGQPQCVIDQVIPTGMDNCSFMTQPAPHHIVPQNFTRTDKPSNYAYTDKRYTSTKETEAPTGSPPRDSVHKRTRGLRSGPVSVVLFNLVDDLPTEPHEESLKRKSEKSQFYPQINNEFVTVKKLFEERPIWSMNMIRYVTKIKFPIVKIILPCLGFYFKNGPWRLLWVRFGYDPRQDPGARIYQTLDFRLRHQAGVHSMVMTREQISNYKKSDRVWHTPKDGQEAGGSSEEISEGAVLFRPGMAPAQRQIFYQYCDVKLPEVEQLIGAEPPHGYLCHHKRGWLQPNADQECRDHIFRYVKQSLLATHSADLKLEQGSDASDEESNIEESNIGDESISSDEATSNPIHD